MIEWMKEYFKTQDHEKRMEIFKKNAHTLGKADKATLKFRKACKKLGVGVVFADGMTNEQILKVLKSDEVQKMMKENK